MKQKLIFLDIDGTLLPPGEMTVPASAVEAIRQARADNQRTDKRVESYLVRCLDGGSTPPISTKSP